jgi:hypothetical protein
VTEDVDAVVLWVDGSDPEWLENYERAFRATDPDGRSAESRVRHRDNGELRYCLRSIEQNAPWIRKIHIVTAGQIPPFVDPSHPRISVVFHDQFFPGRTSGELLPTFNSFAIDASLHLIDDVADGFLRFSDDFFVLSPIEKEWALGTAGHGRHIFSGRVPSPHELAEPNPYRATLARSRLSLTESTGATGAHNAAHAPQLRRREIVNAMESQMAEKFVATRNARFRTADCLSMLYAYPHFVAHQILGAERDGLISHPDFIYKGRPGAWVYQQVHAGRSDELWRERLMRARERGVKYLNVNDGFGSEPKVDDRKFLEQFMDETFPTPASFEIPD